MYEFKIVSRDCTPDGRPHLREGGDEKFIPSSLPPENPWSATGHFIYITHNAFLCVFSICLDGSMDQKAWRWIRSSAFYWISGELATGLRVSWTIFRHAASMQTIFPEKKLRKGLDWWPYTPFWLTLTWAEMDVVKIKASYWPFQNLSKLDVLSFHNKAHYNNFVTNL